MTKKQKKDYLESPSHCPKCKGINITGGHIEVDGETAWQNITCEDCDASWSDIYTLSDVEMETDVEMEK